MRHILYFSIRGNERLRIACVDDPLVDAEGLRGPFLYEVDFAERATWRIEEYLTGVTFVAYIKCCMTDAGMRGRIFGGLEVGVSTFDRWWELDTILGCDHISYLVQEVAQTGGLPELETNANEWLKSMIPRFLERR